MSHKFLLIFMFLVLLACNEDDANNDGENPTDPKNNPQRDALMSAWDNYKPENGENKVFTLSGDEEDGYIETLANDKQCHYLFEKENLDYTHDKDWNYLVYREIKNFNLGDDTTATVQECIDHAKAKYDEDRAVGDLFFAAILLNFDRIYEDDPNPPYKAVLLSVEPFVSNGYQLHKVRFSVKGNLGSLHNYSLEMAKLFPNNRSTFNGEIEIIFASGVMPGAYIWQFKSKGEYNGTYEEEFDRILLSIDGVEVPTF